MPEAAVENLAISAPLRLTENLFGPPHRFLKHRITLAFDPLQRASVLVLCRLKFALLFFCQNPNQRAFAPLLSKPPYAAARGMTSRLIAASSMESRSY